MRRERDRENLKKLINIGNPVKNMLAIYGFLILLFGFLLLIRKSWNHFKFLKEEKKEKALFRDLLDPSKELAIKLKATSPLLIYRKSENSIIDNYRISGNNFAKLIYAYVGLIIIIHIFFI